MRNLGSLGSTHLRDVNLYRINLRRIAACELRRGFMVFWIRAKPTIYGEAHGVRVLGLEPLW